MTTVGIQGFCTKSERYSLIRKYFYPSSRVIILGVMQTLQVIPDKHRRNSFHHQAKSLGRHAVDLLLPFNRQPIVLTSTCSSSQTNHNEQEFWDIGPVTTLNEEIGRFGGPWRTTCTRLASHSTSKSSTSLQLLI